MATLKELKKVKMYRPVYKGELGTYSLGDWYSDKRIREFGTIVGWQEMEVEVEE